MAETFNKSYYQNATCFGWGNYWKRRPRLLVKLVCWERTKITKACRGFGLGRCGEFVDA